MLVLWILPCYIMSSETPTSRMRTCFVRSLFEAARSTFILHIWGPSTGLLSDDFMIASDRIVLVKFNKHLWIYKKQILCYSSQQLNCSRFPSQTLPSLFQNSTTTALLPPLIFWGWLWPRGRIQRKAVKKAASCGRMAGSGHCSFWISYSVQNTFKENC